MKISDFVSFMKRQRKELGVTQLQLAEHANLSRPGILKIEREESDIKLTTLVKIASLLGYEIILRKRTSK